MRHSSRPCNIVNIAPRYLPIIINFNIALIFECSRFSLLYLHYSGTVELSMVWVQTNIYGIRRCCNPLFFKTLWAPNSVVHVPRMFISNEGKWHSTSRPFWNMFIKKIISSYKISRKRNFNSSSKMYPWQADYKIRLFTTGRG